VTMLEPGTAHGNVLADLIDVRLNRRKAIGLGIAGGATVWLAKVPGLSAASAVPQAAPLPALEGLLPVADTVDEFRAAPGLDSDILITWGDPVVTGAPAFDVNAQTAAAQAMQFGYNADYTAIFEFDDGYLLCVNHEYTNGPEMFPNYPDPTIALVADLQPYVDIELAAHGVSVVRLSRTGAKFSVVADAANRRLTANTTYKLSGPGVAVLGTDSVVGMLNNCAGGVTPWGTLLTCEENFNQYFANVSTCPDPVAVADHEVYGLPAGASERGWERVYPNRFDTAVAPREAWKFGYVVEIDPTDPNSVPVKHTALGRTKHEAANTWIALDGRVVVYSGDDERFQYLYKFVTDGMYDPNNRAANLTLLESGTLYVGRFDADGTGTWLPLVYAGNEAFWNGAGFMSQGDICVHTRQAATAVGATKMDRPEDVEVNPVTGAVYMALTNNTQRADPGKAPVDAANPRPKNKHGHIIEMVEAGGDHAATTFTWDIFMLCGFGDQAANLVASPDAATSVESTYFAGWTGPSTIISCPDNLAFDQAGNMIVGTDGAPSPANVNDGVFVVPTAGAYRGRLVQLAAVPAGAECTGPFLSADDRTMLVAVQHPGEGGTFPDGQPELNALSRWPDSTATGAPAVPRSGVVQLTRADGSKIVPTATAKLIPLAPQRLLDTRNKVGVDTTTPLGKDSTLELDLLLSPAQLSSLAAVVLNTTVDQAADPGFVTVYPAGAPQPVVSALNLDERGQARANLVTTAVGNTGAVAFYLDQGGHLIADINAIYAYVSGSRDGRYQATGPTRILDTRDGLGAPQAKVAAGGVVELTVAGAGGVPASGASAVVLNVTATEVESSGYVSVYPAGSPPEASNLNYAGPGRDAAAQVIVPVGPDGKVRLFTFAAAHLVTDVAGWFTDDSAAESDAGLFVPVTSARALDTRNGIGGPTGKVAAGATVTVQITGFGGIPATGVAAVVANLTLVEADKAGFVTAWPTGAPMPYASSVNGDRAGAVVANHITIPVGADGSISLYNDAGGHLLVDVTGWYTS
jgi:secreted PhoX family phosphatase